MSMSETSGNRIGRATWSPLCDPLLETWRHNCRDWLARLYAFAVPNKEVLREISKHAPIVEMGAGTGYWASQIKNLGVDIVAYDVKPPASSSSSGGGTTTTGHSDSSTGGGSNKFSRKNRPTKKQKMKAAYRAQRPNEYHGETSQFCEVLEGSNEELLQHKQRSLLLCYPPPNDDMATQCVRSYEGSTLLYVGEWSGLTANTEFERTVQREWTLKRRLPLPNFGNQISEMFVFKRRRVPRLHTLTSSSSSS
jgi:hypothetical protein